MMLLKPYIKQSRLGFIVSLMTCTIAIQGCSTSPDTESTQSDVALVGMVNIQQNTTSNQTEGISNTEVSSNVAILHRTNRDNSYLNTNNINSISNDTQQQFQQGIEAMKQQQWTVAQQQFDAVISQNPTLSGPWVNLSLIAIELGQPDIALQHIEKALQLAPNNPYARQVFALLLTEKGEFKQAKQQYLRALNIWPDYPQALVNLAILLEMYQGELLQAREYYLAYLNLDKQDQQVQRYLAAVEIKIQRAGLTIPETSIDSSNVQPHDMQTEIEDKPADTSAQQEGS
ncbi:tetratricopeptide repeat protein [Shewanella maritima]|uniref:tetratricopeptide repeat protein n=1 Tax=Shewanella maritima TaxID=2520507 RepID=UPI003736E70E